MTRTRSQAAAPIAVSVGLGALVFVLDLMLPLGAGIGASYVVMVLIGLWLPWRCAPLLLATVATTLIVLDGLLSAPAGPLRPAMADRGLALGAIWLAAVLVARRRASEQALPDSASRADSDTIHGGDAIATQREVSAPLAEVFTGGRNAVRTGTGVGVAVFAEDGAEPDPSIRNGGPALGRAKAEHRGRLDLFVPAMTAETRLRRSLEGDLHRALERNQLAVLYQPQLDLRSGRIVAVEALTRWRHPRHGSVPPAVFIPVAEASGLIRPLGAWVLREACRQARAWQDAGRALGIAVNLSPAQLLRQDLAAQLDDVLGATGLDPHLLELEITENVFVDPGRRAVTTVLQRVADRGVNLTIDDFGTGYASFAYLKGFPVTKIKINGGFVHDIGRTRGDEAIVQAIVALGHSLGKRVIAEGVETAAQLAFLHERGCDLAQGFLLGRPHTAEDLGRLLAAWPETWRGLKAAVGPAASATAADSARSRRGVLHRAEAPLLGGTGRRNNERKKKRPSAGDGR